MNKKIIAIMMMVTGITAGTLAGCGSSKDAGGITDSTLNTAADQTSETASVEEKKADKTNKVKETTTVEADKESDSQIEEVTTKESKAPAADSTAKKDADINNAGEAKATTPKEETSAPASSKEETQAPAAPSHTHNFQPVYKTIHHDAVTHTEDQGHYENVMVQDAKYETKTVHHYGRACSCGWEGYGNSDSEACNLLQAHLDSTGHADACARQKTVGYDETTNVKVSDPVYENQWVSNIVAIVDKEAYDEQVLDHNECSCGARQ